jgi:hypothetical protein
MRYFIPIIVVIALFLMVQLTGCSNTYSTYKLSTGEIVTCKACLLNKCGVSLWNCTNGSEYACLTNVQELPDKK